MELRIDSVEVRAQAIELERTLISDGWDTFEYGDWARILICPISLPKGYRSDFEISFVFSAYNTTDNSLLERKGFNLHLKYRKERGIYQGR